VGHDINYIALTDALDTIGPANGAPVRPLNLVSDYGGAMFLAFGALCALREARDSGQGQVIDSVMVDGARAARRGRAGVQRIAPKTETRSP
jgi:alpha-methylacyl-CoA racemase